MASLSTSPLTFVQLTTTPFLRDPGRTMMPGLGMTALRVLVDGVSLPDEGARAFWRRYSVWMEEHAGDLEGFASSEGLKSVHPEMHDGGPVLVASHAAPQRPYSAAPRKRPRP